MNKYIDLSYQPRLNAQRNLCGRTHYVDDDTLRFHHSRILSTHVTDDGLLFALVESYAVDMRNTERAYRGVIFDIFGNIINRPKLEEGYTSKKRALANMWDVLNTLDAKEITRKGVEIAIKNYREEMSEVLNWLEDRKVAA